MHAVRIFIVRKGKGKGKGKGKERNGKGKKRKECRTYEENNTNLPASQTSQESTDFIANLPSQLALWPKSAHNTHSFQAKNIAGTLK